MGQIKMEKHFTDNLKFTVKKRYGKDAKNKWDFSLVLKVYREFDVTCLRPWILALRASRVAPKTNYWLRQWWKDMSQVSYDKQANKRVIDSPSSMHVIPRDHTSTLPSYCPSSMASITSGAIQYGVPTNELAGLTTDAEPKSATTSTNVTLQLSLTTHLGGKIFWGPGFGGVVVRASDLWPTGCQFDSQPFAAGLLLWLLTTCGRVKAEASTHITSNLGQLSLLSLWGR